MDDLAKAGVVVFPEDACKGWLPSAAAMLAALKRFHGGLHGYAEIGPCSTAQWLEKRNALYDAAPGLVQFVGQAQLKLRDSCAVLVPSMGLQGFSLEDRATLAYAVALCFGNPTATDTKQVVWDVKAREKEGTQFSTLSGAEGDTTHGDSLRAGEYFSTFSETDAEAAFHTDTQYYPEPEPTFVLYCIKEASCGGGYSRILDARALRADLARTHPWVLDVLSKRLLPFRIPSAFVTGDDSSAVEATLAPVFGPASGIDSAGGALPFIRYRKDTLDKGFKAFAEYKLAEVERAIDALEDELKNSPHQAEFFMPTDSLVLVDNHKALHARTGFTDHNRHLLRIRMQGIGARRSSLKIVRRRMEERALDPA